MGLTPGGSSTVHIYTQTIYIYNNTINNKNNTINNKKNTNNKNNTINLYRVSCYSHTWTMKLEAAILAAVSVTSYQSTRR